MRELTSDELKLVTGGAETDGATDGQGGATPDGHKHPGITGYGQNPAPERQSNALQRAAFEFMSERIRNEPIEPVEHGGGVRG
ncbi:MAG: hypothetical protein MRY72_12690 [Aquisalinus sp.]|nr:hypothetical protein [Aquisalinus sp.]